MKPLTLELFQQSTGAPRDRAELFYEPTLSAMERFKIEDLYPVSAFTATVAIESNRLQSVEESLYYKDPARIAALYLRVFDEDKDRHIDPEEIELAKAYVRNHNALSKLLYKGYHGRGLIQLTWERNYALATVALGYDYIGNPNLMLQPKHAALTAAWFWSVNKCSDAAKDIRACTAIVNPALMHLKERTAQYEQNLRVFA